MKPLSCNICLTVITKVLRLVCTGSLMLWAFSAQADDFATFNAQYGKQSVVVNLLQNGVPTGQSWTLTGIQDGQIEIRMPGGGGMGMEPSRQLAEQLRFPDHTNDLYRAAVRAGQFANAAKELRPRVYPLLKFAALPADFKQLHDAISALLLALSEGALFDEALAIFDHYDALLRQERFQQAAFSLIQSLAEADKTKEAVALLGKIPVDQLPEGLMSSLMTFAYNLRVRGEYEALIPVYETMIPELKGDLLREAQIWLAYSHAAIDQNDKSAAIFATIEAPRQGEQGFGLYQLLIGYRLYRQGEYSNALDILANGLVYASSNESWIPEALFYLGRAYRESQRLTAARNTFEELYRLFPDSQWAPRAREQHQAITRQIQELQAQS
jgi:tetratricopeptide (TPR) repeat protein